MKKSFKLSLISLGAAILIVGTILVMSPDETPSAHFF